MSQSDAANETMERTTLFHALKSSISNTLRRNTRVGESESGKPSRLTRRVRPRAGPCGCAASLAGTACRPKIRRDSRDAHGRL